MSLKGTSFMAKIGGMGALLLILLALVGWLGSRGVTNEVKEADKMKKYFFTRFIAIHTFCGKR